MPRKKSSEEIRKNAREQIAQILIQIREVDYVCSGTLLRRMMTCGKSACRCAHDSDARHGPYFEWGRMKRGKLVHRMVSKEQATILRAAIHNYRTIRRLLRAWEEQTVKVIEAEKRRN